MSFNFKMMSIALLSVAIFAAMPFSVFAWSKKAPSGSIKVIADGNDTLLQTQPAGGSAGSISWNYGDSQAILDNIRLGAIASNSLKPGTSTTKYLTVQNLNNVTIKIDGVRVDNPGNFKGSFSSTISSNPIIIGPSLSKQVAIDIAVDIDCPIGNYSVAPVVNGAYEATTGCINDCLAYEQKRCSGTGFQVCGYYDSDSCFDWSTVQSCGINEACRGNGLCVSNVPEPSCDDGIKNQDETSSDCGGSCSAKCSNGEFCLQPSDCQSGYCKENVCQAEPVAVPQAVKPTILKPQTNSSYNLQCGNSFSLRVETNNPENRKLFYTFGYLPNGMTVDSAGLIRWTPSNDQCGTTQPVTICASTLYDGDCSQANVNFTVNVAAQQNQSGQQTTSVAQNQKPSIVQPSPNAVYTLQCNQNFSLQVAAKDNENDKIYYSFSEQPSNMQISQSGLIQWVPSGNKCGTQSKARVCVYDDNSQTSVDRNCNWIYLNVGSQTTQNYINNQQNTAQTNNNSSGNTASNPAVNNAKSVNQPPVFGDSNANTMSWPAGSNVVVYFTANDQDKDKLTFTVETQLPNRSVSVTANTLTLRWTAGGAGNYTQQVKVCVDDGVRGHKICKTWGVNILAKPQTVTNWPSSNTNVINEYISSGLLIPRTFSFQNYLGLGSQNNQVYYLQKLLNYTGYMVAYTGNGSLNNETYYFGNLTQVALIRFQRANYLSASGVLDTATRMILNNRLAGLRQSLDSNNNSGNNDLPTATWVETEPFVDKVDPVYFLIKIGQTTWNEAKDCMAKGDTQECLSTCGVAFDAAVVTAPISVACDFVNGAIYLYKGDNLSAGASLFAVIPLAGTVGKQSIKTGAKIEVKLSKEASEAVAEAAVKAGTVSVRDLGKTVSISGDVWLQGWANRGKLIDIGLGNNLGTTFKGVDKFSDGTVTSIKSMDIKASTYQNANNIYSKLKYYVDGVKGFEKYGTITKDMITGRAIELALPDVNITSAQYDALQKAVQYAKSQGIGFTITIVK
jgi:hypothetical protein